MPQCKAGEHSWRVEKNSDECGSWIEYDCAECGVTTENPGLYDSEEEE